MEEGRESSLPGIVCVLDTVDNSSPVLTEIPHLIRNDPASSVEPLIANEGKGEEGCFMEFVGPTSFEREADTVNE